MKCLGISLVVQLTLAMNILDVREILKFNIMRNTQDVGSTNVSNKKPGIRFLFSEF